MPNRPDSIVGSIGVEFTGDASGVEQAARRAERSVDRTAESLERLEGASAGSIRAAERWQREYEDAITRGSQASEESVRRTNRLALSQQVAAKAAEASDQRRLLSRQKLARQIKATEASIAIARALGEDEKAIDAYVQKLGDLQKRVGILDLEDRRASLQRRLRSQNFSQQEENIIQQRIDALDRLLRKEDEIYDIRDRSDRGTRRRGLAQVQQEIRARDETLRQSREISRLNNQTLKETDSIVDAHNRMGRSILRNSGYLARQLRALRDFFIRYLAIVALFAVPAAGAALAGVSIAGGEDFIVRQRQLEALIGTYGDFAVAQQRIRDASDATRTSFQQTTDIFETLYLQFQDMPFAIEQTASVTEGINLLFRGSAASAEEMSRAIVQLRQGFAKGIFSAQDVRILTEQIRLFDDFLRAAGLPVGQRLDASQLRAALAAGAGRGLLEQRAGAIDTRISVNARRVADSFFRVSATALESSGFLDAVNLGLEYFETLLLSGQFEQWLTDAYETGTAFISVLANAQPQILQFGEGLVEASFAIIRTVGILVYAIARYSQYIEYVIQGLIGTAVFGGIGRAIAGFTIGRLFASGAAVALAGALNPAVIATTIVGTILAAVAGLITFNVLGRAAQSAIPTPSADFSSIQRQINLFRGTGGLLTPEGDFRYRAFDAEIRRRAAELGKEEGAVVELTQVYRDLEKQYDSVFDITPALSFEDKLRNALGNIGDHVAELRARLSQTLGGADDTLLDTILGFPLKDINTADAEQVANFAKQLAALSPNITANFETIRRRVGGRRTLTEELESLEIGGTEVDIIRLIDDLRKAQDRYSTLTQQSGKTADALSMFNKSIAELEYIAQLIPIPDVERERFNALAKVYSDRSGVLNGLLRQLDTQKLDDTFDEVVSEIENEGLSIESGARRLARLRYQQGLDNYVRALESRNQVELIKAVESGDQARVKAIQDQLDVLMKARDATVQLKNGQILLSEAESELARVVADGADDTTQAAYQKRVDAAKRYVNFQLEYLKTLGLIDGINDKIFNALLEIELNRLKNRDRVSREDIFDFDFIDVLAQRALGQQVDTEQNRLDFLSQFGGLNARRQAQLENSLFLRQQQAAARLALESAKRLEDADAIREAENRLNKINEALTSNNALVRQNIEAWIQARVAQLEFADETERINMGLDNLARVSQFAVESLRDGFITAIDEAERFQDVIHGIALGLRNLILDIAVFEPLERGLRTVLQDSFLNTVIQPTTSSAPPLGNPLAAVGAGATFVVQNYNTNNMSAAADVQIQREQDQFAVNQAVQLGRGIFGLFGGR